MTSLCSAACELFSLLTAHQPPTKTREICKTCSLQCFFDSPPSPCAILNSESICAFYLPSLEAHIGSCELLIPKLLPPKSRRPLAQRRPRAELSPPAGPLCHVSSAGMALGSLHTMSTHWGEPQPMSPGSQGVCDSVFAFCRET